MAGDMSSVFPFLELCLKLMPGTVRLRKLLLWQCRPMQIQPESNEFFLCSPPGKFYVNTIQKK